MNDTVTVLLGKPVAYWLELDERFKKEHTFNEGELLQEIIMLRGKLSFYESRVKEMSNLI